MADKALGMSVFIHKTAVLPKGKDLVPVGLVEPGPISCSDGANRSHDEIA
jgi:hypothetical protein